MGKVLTKVSFWNADMEVKEVQSASHISFFHVKTLKPYSKEEYQLSRYDNGHYLVEFKNGHWFEFK